MIMSENTIVELCEKAKDNDSLAEEIESLAKLNKITEEYIVKILRREGIELPTEYKKKKSEEETIEKFKNAMKSGNSVVIDQRQQPIPEVVKSIFERILEDLEKEIDYHKERLEELNRRYEVITDYIK